MVEYAAKDEIKDYVRPNWLELTDYVPVEDINFDNFSIRINYELYESLEQDGFTDAYNKEMMWKKLHDN